MRVSKQKKRACDNDTYPDISVPYVGIIQIRLFGSRVTPSSQPVYKHPVYYFLRFPHIYSTTPNAFCQDFACVLGLVSAHVDLFLAQFRINKLLSRIKAEITREQEAYKRRDHAEQCAFAAEELYAEQNCRNGAVRHTAEQRRYANGRAERGTQTDKQRQHTAELHRENMRAFDYILSLSERPTVWAAWGTVIEKRDYLWDCLQEMIAIGQEHGARWVKCGRVSAAGHPHHPLYLRADSRIEDFPVEEYAARRPAAKKKRRGGGGL